MTAMNVNAAPKVRVSPAQQPAFSLARSPARVLQRACACGSKPGVDGECPACRKKRQALQRSPLVSPERGPGGEVPPIVHDVLRSPGQPLDAATRAFMEPRFGHDFSAVRMFADAPALTDLRHFAGGQQLQTPVAGPSQFTTTAANASAQQAPPPALDAGSIKITDFGTTLAVKQAVYGNMSTYDVHSGFKAKVASVRIKEPPTAIFEYGLVQNVIYDHFEAKFDPEGDMLVDTVGPFVDVWFTESPPFGHEGSDNPSILQPGLFGPTLSVSFVDRPGWPLNAVETYCDRSVALESATDTTVFRVGLVARNLRNRNQLGVFKVSYEL